ncbi:Uncharacterised protein [Mycobacterium tuberculosis]|nr:Uncharacterised protein [Mycobacterium tuberculosis]
MLDCRGNRIQASNLQGERVNFAGSEFEDMSFENARINS